MALQLQVHPRQKLTVEPARIAAVRQVLSRDCSIIDAPIFDSGLVHRTRNRCGRLFAFRLKSPGTSSTADHDESCRFLAIALGEINSDDDNDCSAIGECHVADGGPNDETFFRIAGATEHLRFGQSGTLAFLAFEISSHYTRMLWCALVWTGGWESNTNAHRPRVQVQPQGVKSTESRCASVRSLTQLQGFNPAGVRLPA